MTAPRAQDLLAVALRRAAPPEVVGGLDLPAAWPRDPLDPRAWAPLRAMAAHQRVTGPLLESLVDGTLPATEVQYEDLAAAHLHAMTIAVRLDRQLVMVAGLLEEEGIDVVTLKGPAVARLDYRDPSLRSYGDVDLLLRAGDLEVAFELLDALDYERPAARLRSDFDRRFGKGATFVGSDGLELDVHRTFVFGALGVRIDSDGLFSDVEEFRVGDRSLRALAPAARCLHACYHAALGSPQPRWSTLQDVLQIHPVAEPLAGQVLDLAREWGGMAVLQRAHRLVTRELGVTLRGPLAAAVAAHEPAPRERRVIATYVGRHRSFAAQVVAMLPTLPTWGDRVALVRAVVVPDADSIHSRGTKGRLHWIQRGVRSLTGEVRR